MITIIGNHVSPYVRKVLAALELKGLSYRVDPIIPFFGDDRFAAMSPLRRVPVLIDGQLVLPDSTVICEFLDSGPRRPPPTSRWARCCRCRASSGCRSILNAFRAAPRWPRRSVRIRRWPG